MEQRVERWTIPVGIEAEDLRVTAGDRSSDFGAECTSPGSSLASAESDDPRGVGVGARGFEAGSDVGANVIHDGVGDASGGRGRRGSYVESSSHAKRPTSVSVRGRTIGADRWKADLPHTSSLPSDLSVVPPGRSFHLESLEHVEYFASSELGR
jgi:hypothetical protein